VFHFLKHLLNNCYMNTFRKQLKKSFKNDFEKHLKDIALKGIENIKSELLKSGKDAYVSYKIEKNKIKYIVEPKIENVSNEKVLDKKFQSTFKGFENIPLEMLNEQLVEESFPINLVDKALQKTQKDSDKKVSEIIKKLI